MSYGNFVLSYPLGSAPTAEHAPSNRAYGVESWSVASQDEEWLKEQAEFLELAAGADSEALSLGD